MAHIVNEFRELKIVGGTAKTPNGWGLCETCRNGLHIQGEAVSDDQMFCGLMKFSFRGNLSRITHPVVKCSGYEDITFPRIEEMQSAWILKNDGHGHIKCVPPE